MRPTRDFTATTFVVQQGKVLLLFHRKLQMWLPPGGHIDPDELPDEAALREALEETGVEIELVGEREPAGFAYALARPRGVQLETIAPGHEHIDLIYFGRPVGGRTRLNAREAEQVGWFGLDELEGLGVNDEIRYWCRKAVAALEG